MRPAPCMARSAGDEISRLHAPPHSQSAGATSAGTRMHGVPGVASCRDTRRHWGWMSRKGRALYGFARPTASRAHLQPSRPRMFMVKLSPLCHGQWRRHGSRDAGCAAASPCFGLRGSTRPPKGGKRQRGIGVSAPPLCCPRQPRRVTQANQESEETHAKPGGGGTGQCRQPSRVTSRRCAGGVAWRGPAATVMNASPRGAAAAAVRQWYGHGTAAIRPRYGCGTAAVRVRAWLAAYR